MKTSVAVLLLALTVNCLPIYAVPVTFNLRDTNSVSEIESGNITRGGITAILTPIVQGSNGTLHQTAGGFGVDATPSGDNTHEIDDAKGVESISLSFNHDLVLLQLVLSDFTTSETALLTIGNFSTKTLTGTTPSSDIFTFASENFVSAGQTILLEWGSSSASTGRGFSFDSFTVDVVNQKVTVPDSSPAPAGLAFLVGMLAFARRTKCHC